MELFDAIVPWDNFHRLICLIQEGKPVFPNNLCGMPVIISHFKQIGFGCLCINMNRSAFRFNFLLRALNISCCDIYSCFLWRIDARKINLEHVILHAIHYFDNINEVYSPKVGVGVFRRIRCCREWANNIT